MNNCAYLVDREWDSTFSQVRVDGDDGEGRLEAGHGRHQPLCAGVCVDHDLVAGTKSHRVKTQRKTIDAVPDLLVAHPGVLASLKSKQYWVTLKNILVLVVSI